MNSAANTREYLALRISELQSDIQAMSIDNGAALAIEFARINELKRVLFILNGGKVPQFEMEVTSDL